MQIVIRSSSSIKVISIYLCRKELYMATYCPFMSAFKTQECKKSECMFYDDKWPGSKCTLREGISASFIANNAVIAMIENLSNIMEAQMAEEIMKAEKEVLTEKETLEGNKEKNGEENKVESSQ